jgi:uncharacterized protein (DUF58 family)
MTATGSMLDPRLLERIKGLSLTARRIVEGALHGMHRSPMHGLSIEFAQHRQYTPGDELKHLDWRVLGRNDRYVIKQYEQETNLRAMLLVDASASMAYSAKTTSQTPGSEGQAPRSADAQPERLPGDGPAQPTGQQRGMSKFDYARTLAAALGYLLLHQGDSVGLTISGGQTERQAAPKAAPGHLLSLCHLLHEAEPSGQTSLSRIIADMAGRLRRRSLIVVISDLLEEPAPLLGALGQAHHRGHEVVIFQVLDPRELDFDLGYAGHGMTVIRDMETGSEFEAEPHLIQEMVQREVDQFMGQLDLGARRHGVHLLRCTTDQPVDQILTEYLHYRNRGRRGSG